MIPALSNLMPAAPVVPGLEPGDDSANPFSALFAALLPDAGAVQPAADPAETGHAVVVDAETPVMSPEDLLALVAPPPASPPAPIEDAVAQGPNPPTTPSPEPHHSPIKPLAADSKRAIAEPLSFTNAVADPVERRPGLSEENAARPIVGADKHQPLPTPAPAPMMPQPDPALPVGGAAPPNGPAHGELPPAPARIERGKVRPLGDGTKSVANSARLPELPAEQVPAAPALPRDQLVRLVNEELPAPLPPMTPEPVRTTPTAQPQIPSPTQPQAAMAQHLAGQFAAALPRLRSAGGEVLLTLDPARLGRVTLAWQAEPTGAAVLTVRAVEPATAALLSRMSEDLAALLRTDPAAGGGTVSDVRLDIARIERLPDPRQPEARQPDATEHFAAQHDAASAGQGWQQHRFARSPEQQRQVLPGAVVNAGEVDGDAPREPSARLA